MRSITHARDARDPLLRVVTDGGVVDVEVGLTDADGRHVTRVDILLDDESRGGDRMGHVWYRDGARLVRLEKGEAAPMDRVLRDDKPPRADRTRARLGPPVPGRVVHVLPDRAKVLLAHAAAARQDVQSEALPSRVLLLVEAIEELLRPEEGESQPQPTQEELVARLRELKSQGLHFGSIIPVYAEDTTPRQQRLIAAARDNFEREGELEFDDTPVASGSTSRGDYVMAWVWVADSEEQPTGD